MDIRHRVAIVTGGASGTGRVIASRLSDLGATVIVADIADGTDVTTDAGRAEILDSASRAGGPHILVNNAGGWSPSGLGFPDASPHDWRTALELNLGAPMALTQLCLPIMARLGGGAVVNIASEAALGDEPYGSPEYAAAKAGLIRFSTSVAQTQGVRVNCLVPGWIGLDRAHAQVAALSPAEQAALPPLIPPEEVADAVVEMIANDALAGKVAVLEGGRPRRLR
ncbi:NAD(P)-dependent dehydrogenase (short-subunit alcohol dehydrogenase family) [Actinoplanes lutulentus]|uniref:3-oxoacyl-[acyl-carrier protein] reductase/15-hydroxyprostaglandin dehydrogenase (NAD)/7-alpha-hydroxysteroid dehydrogenase n=1 Tax=Actinoplanes lutulentus TaxID=1287878 RepID=A0A327Z9R8_9ACTN|nr:SDR family oxidoreductase [Actinoplanes lutulentus]MBB2943185.1 NAD(P)-dependent dehydrogenase (short-subunit alcohol dehydrogenase family) [Actinoplanes lutulentus]RAK28251.1 3-oxoacyl-[acyl-carrier protein] reductase/15-hydroxyprostaglandin dehydrogenase (NAD)/7-alpha-hydroxysteroid dehydrogenase [Actinoplanes lutulentus]